jgi:hypothetical protein
VSADQLREKASRLIEAAKTSMNPTRRRLLMDEAFELIRKSKRSRDREPARIRRASPPSQGFHMSLYGGGGTTLELELKVSSKADAFWAAATLAHACSDAYTDYTLREGTAYLDCDETTAGRACEQTDSDVTPASLLSVLEIQETLLRTHEALSGSRTLLAATENLRMRIVTRRLSAYPAGQLCSKRGP